MTALQTVAPLATGDLLVTIPDPPAGTGYQDDHALTVPTGFQWRVKTVSFNLTTNSAVGSRRLKWVMRDPTDPVNPGRLFVVCQDGLVQYTYKDVSLAIGQNFVPGKVMPAGTGMGNLLRSPSNAGLPDVWTPPGFQWVTISEGLAPADQFSFFYAIVEQASC